MKKIFAISLIIFTLISCRDKKEHYQIEISKYKINAHRLFNEKTQEIFQVESILEPIIIKFPVRIDSVSKYDKNGNVQIDTSITSYFTVHQIIDTLQEKAVDTITDSEINLFYKNKKLKISGIQIRVLFPDGSSYSNYIMGNKINLDSEAVKEINKKINNSYIVISGVYFLNDKGEEIRIKDDIAWKMKY